MSLILRLQDPEDLNAWQEFVEIYEPVVQALARKRGLQKADVDDVTQEVFSRVAQHVEKWDPSPEKGSFRGWLITITRNLVIQFFRDRNKHPTTGLDSGARHLLEDVTEEAQAYDQELERQLFVWAARKIQVRFEEKTWKSFWHSTIEGQSIEEVSNRLEIPKSHVYVSRSRVINLLKKTIEQTKFDSAFFSGGQQ